MDIVDPLILRSIQAQVWFHHLPTLTMLVYAYASGRSLGAAPPYGAALVIGFAVTVLSLSAEPGSAFTLLADCMLVPTLLLTLARRQIIRGLRRGQMTDAERARWIARNAFASGKAHDHALTSWRPAADARSGRPR